MVPAYRLAALPDDPSSGEGGNLDVSLQLHLLLGSKEVLFFQFAKYATLSLQPDMMETRLLRLHPRHQLSFSPQKRSKLTGKTS